MTPSWCATRSRTDRAHVKAIFTLRPQIGENQTLEPVPDVIEDEHKLVARMVPLLQRVLIVDPSPASSRLLADLMRNVSSGQTWNAPDNRRGLATAELVNPQLIFVELSGPNVSGLDFARQLRRSEYSCRKAPIVMVTATATAAAILGARDAGVHEFLRKPFTLKDLLRRLEAVTLRRRDWVEAIDYIGPDRRRFNSGDYSGKLKRQSDATATPDAARITQALKILKSALRAVETDPRQALRSMQAQVVDLREAGKAMANLPLISAVTAFQTYLTEAAARGPLASIDVAAKAASVLAFLPNEAPRPTAPGQGTVAI